MTILAAGSPLFLGEVRKILGGDTAYMIDFRLVSCSGPWGIPKGNLDFMECG